MASFVFFCHMRLIHDKHDNVALNQQTHIGLELALVDIIFNLLLKYNKDLVLIWHTDCVSIDVRLSYF